MVPKQWQSPEKQFCNQLSIVFSLIISLDMHEDKSVACLMTGEMHGCDVSMVTTTHGSTQGNLCTIITDHLRSAVSAKSKKIIQASEMNLLRYAALKFVLEKY